jgi:predicted transcriptional regulator
MSHYEKNNKVIEMLKGILKVGISFCFEISRLIGIVKSTEAEQIEIRY